MVQISTKGWLYYVMVIAAAIVAVVLYFYLLPMYPLAESVLGFYLSWILLIGFTALTVLMCVGGLGETRGLLGKEKIRR